jgi:uncharacterized protein DUF4345
MASFVRWFLLLTGVVFAAIGVYTLVDPAQTLALVGLQVIEVSSRNEMRAVYGGLNLAVGLYLCAAFGNAGLRPAALTFIALITGGLVFGRLVSLVVDGMPNTAIWYFLAIEVTGCVLALLLRRNAAN